jgi:hypothetical protein
MASWFDMNPANAGDSAWGGQNYGNWGTMASGLANLWGGIQGANNANQVNNQVSGALGQNSSAYQQQIQSLQEQIKANQAQAQQAYEAARANATTQNQGLEGDIGNMTSNLTALNDPNSPYMQMARQAIERKDASAGRRSQWGEREVQLAGTLADYVGKYAPGLQNSITAARNQINQNNQGLASMYSTMNNPADRNMLALAQLLQGQQQGAAAANTTGRAAANSATNNLTGAITGGLNAAGGLLGGLGSLFGNSGGGSFLDSWGANTGLGGGGWANAGMNNWGSDGLGDGGWGFGNGLGQGFGAGGLGGGFLDIGGTGSLGSGLDFSNGGLGGGFDGFGPSFGSGLDDIW